MIAQYTFLALEVRLWMTSGTPPRNAPRGHNGIKVICGGRFYMIAQYTYSALEVTLWMTSGTPPRNALPDLRKRL